MKPDVYPMYRPHDEGRPVLKIAVAIATANRFEILSDVIPLLARQARQPDEVIVCAPDAADIPFVALSGLSCPVRKIVSQRGLCRQRNEILAKATDADIVLFLDDDFLMAADYLALLERLFITQPGVVMCTGKVEADGILGPGYSVDDGLHILSALNAFPTPEMPRATPIYNCYGCNMAVRMSAVRAINAAFDEDLPLYGWLEDVDFSRQVSDCGDIVRSPDLRGVHLGTKFGRSPGMRLGYSQIANPVYLMRKKTMSFRHAGAQMARNLAANAVKTYRPEPWVDRSGRLKGNLKAVVDLLRGRLSPRNILALD